MPSVCHKPFRANGRLQALASVRWTTQPEIASIRRWGWNWVKLEYDTSQFLQVPWNTKDSAVSCGLGAFHRGCFSVKALSISHTRPKQAPPSEPLPKPLRNDGLFLYVIRKLRRTQLAPLGVLCSAARSKFTDLNFPIANSILFNTAIDCLNAKRQGYVGHGDFNSWPKVFSLIARPSVHPRFRGTP